jgi:IclR family mhp operon transcriptional activator
MDSTRPIRALLRGLDALAALNVRDGASVSELVGAIRLPRTTVYRVLETLSEAGYVHRDEADDRYRLTPMVRGLCDSFDAEARLAAALEPAAAGLAGSLELAAGIATLSGTRMRLREYAAPAQGWTTTYEPLATSAAGRAYLAQCPAAERERLVGALCRPRKGDPAAVPRAELLAALQGIEAQGYAGDAECLCMALRAPAGRIAVLTVRTAAPQAGAERQRLLAAMRACCQSTAGCFEGQPSGTHRAGVPATAH